MRLLVHVPLAGRLLGAPEDDLWSEVTSGVERGQGNEPGAVTWRDKERTRLTRARISHDLITAQRDGLSHLSCDFIHPQTVVSALSGSYTRRREGWKLPSYWWQDHERASPPPAVRPVPDDAKC